MENPPTRVNLNATRGYQRSSWIRQNPDGTSTKVWTFEPYKHVEPYAILNADQATHLAKSKPQDEEHSLQRGAPYSSVKLENKPNVRSTRSKPKQQKKCSDPRNSEPRKSIRNFRQQNLRRKPILSLQKPSDENYFTCVPNESMEDQRYSSKERLWGGNNEEKQEVCSYPHRSRPVNANRTRTPAPVRNNPKSRIYRNVGFTPNQISGYHSAAESVMDVRNYRNFQDRNRNKLSQSSSEQSISQYDIEDERTPRLRLLHEAPSHTEMPVLLCCPANNAEVDGGPCFKVGMHINCIPAKVRLGLPHVDRVWRYPVVPAIITEIQRVDYDSFNDTISDDGSDYDNGNATCRGTRQQMSLNDRFSQGQNGHCSTEGRAKQPTGCRLTEQMAQTEVNGVLEELIETAIQGLMKLSKIFKSGTAARSNLNGDANRRSERELKESLLQVDNDFRKIRQTATNIKIGVEEVAGKRNVSELPKKREIFGNRQYGRCGESSKKNQNSTKESTRKN